MNSLALIATGIFRQRNNEPADESSKCDSLMTNCFGRTVNALRLDWLLNQPSQKHS